MHRSIANHSLHRKPFQTTTANHKSQTSNRMQVPFYAPACGPDQPCIAEQQVRVRVGAAIELRPRRSRGIKPHSVATLCLRLLACSVEQVNGRGASFVPGWVAAELKDELAAATAAATAAAAEAAAAEDATGVFAPGVGSRASGAGAAVAGARRPLLAAFVGAVRVAAPFVVPAPDLTVGNRLRVALACLHDPAGRRRRLAGATTAASGGATAGSGGDGVVFADPSDPFDLDLELAPGLAFRSDVESLARSLAGGEAVEAVASTALATATWGGYYWRALLGAKYDARAVCAPPPHPPPPFKTT